MTLFLGVSVDQDKYINKWSPMVSLSLISRNQDDKLPLFEIKANADLEEEVIRNFDLPPP